MILPYKRYLNESNYLILKEMGYYGIDKISDMKKLFSYLFNTEVF